MIDLNRGGFVGQNACRTAGWIIPFILFMYIFLFVSCSGEPASQDSRGVVPIEVKKNGEEIILYENSYALLVGVSQYEHWPVLKSVPMEIKLL